MREARSKKQEKNSALNLFEKYQSALQAWAGDVPADMQDEDDQEKLLDAMLRLFETLDAHDMRGVLPVLRTQKTPKEMMMPLVGAIRWQMIGLNIRAPGLISELAPHILALALLRWGAIWQNEQTPGMPKLMAAIARDLGYLQRAAEFCSGNFLRAE